MKYFLYKLFFGKCLEHTPILKYGMDGRCKKCGEKKITKQLLDQGYWWCDGVWRKLKVKVRTK